MLVEELAKEKLEKMEAGQVRQLLTKARSTWTRGQTETVKTDKLLKNEVDLVNNDPELQLLLVQQEIISEKIRQRIRLLISSSRSAPFQVSSRGIRISIPDYNLEMLAEECDKAGWDIIPYHADGLAYLNPIGIMKSAENDMHEILPALEKCLKTDIPQVEM